MNVTVFGATGGVGSQVVDQLRSRGHQVTAYVRNPAKVPANWGDDVTLVVGELSDAETVDRAVQGARNITTRCSATVSGATSGTAPPASSTPGRRRPGRPGSRGSWRGRLCAAPTTSCSA